MLAEDSQSFTWAIHSLPWSVAIDGRDKENSTVSFDEYDYGQGNGRGLQ
jgi:hypothetical protein